MSFKASINSSTGKYSVLKLTTDGSNWVTYQARMTAIQAAKGHMPHIRGTARKPPIKHENPHILPPSTTTTALATSQVPDPDAPPPSKATTSTTTAAAIGASNKDAYSHLTDSEYAELVKKMDTKDCTWEAKEADARALVYETLRDDLFIEVQAQPTVKSLWVAIVASCENKSMMYANAIRMRIQNTHCPESGNVHGVHLALLICERQSLAAVGGCFGDAEFVAIITIHKQYARFIPREVAVHPRPGEPLGARYSYRIPHRQAQ